MRQAVFLDRDGTIIEDQGYLRHPSEVFFFSDTIPALRLLQRDFRLFIVTNQSGVAEGVITHSDVERVHQHIVRYLEKYGIHIEHVFCCPHQRSDYCRCIKPNPYFLLKAADEYHIDLWNSFVIGDHPHDVEFARRVGATGIFVLTGHGIKHREELTPDSFIASDIGDAAALAVREYYSRKKPSMPPQPIQQAVSILKNSGVVAFPTETVYGLGANAMDAAAVAKVFEVKRRPRFDPLIVHVCGIQQAESLVAEFPEKARELARCFWPGPLTLVLPKNERVPDIVTAGLPSVAIRMPDHPVALSLIRAAGVPLAAPSANPFGYISPTTANHVREQFGNSIPCVLDGGHCQIGIESTVISFAEESPCLLRPGGLPLKEIHRILGPVNCSQKLRKSMLSPGQLPSHYAPHTPLIQGADRECNQPGRVGLISLKEPENRDGFYAVEVLSSTGDLREAAANLFAALRRLDALSLDAIVFQPVPTDGLGLAIMDRLQRASLGGMQREGGT